MEKYSIASKAAKMFIWSLAYRFMCLVVSVAIISVINNKFGIILSQLFCLGIFLILPYNKMYNLGSQDHNKINYGYAKRDVFMGVKIGCLVAIPYSICGILLILARFGVVGFSILQTYRLINAPYFSLDQILMPTTLTISEQSLFAVAASVLTVFTEPVVYGMGYRMGLARISFTSETGLYRGNRKEKLTKNV